MVLKRANNMNLDSKKNFIDSELTNWSCDDYTFYQNPCFFLSFEKVNCHSVQLLQCLGSG